VATVASSQTNPATATQNINGAEVLVRALIRQGVDLIFAYPGGCSMPMHQSLTYHRDELRTILPRHEQGGGFAAQGVARTTNEVGVVMATSGPGATNLVTAIADAKMDSVPLVAITGQVPTTVIGTDAFQETPIVEICRAVTKHHYLVTDANDIPRIIKEAFHIAKTGRPGPVLVDVPKNVQLTVLAEEPDYDPPMNLPGYHPEVRRPHPNQIRQILAEIRAAKKPVFYIGGGVVQSDAAAEFTKFAKKVNIPVAMTVMGLGAFPGDDPQSLHMLGMHGTVYSNYAVADCDLLLAFGVRFDDRVTGKLDEFVKNARIVHVDIDPSEVNKNKRVHVGVVANIKEVLQGLNALVADDDVPDTAAWWNPKYPLAVKESGDFIIPQYAISELNRQTRDRETYIAVGVGQHQMFAAQYYKFNEPKHWLSSSGLGTMGFGLPAAMGVQARHPDALVIDIDGDGSVLMNIQELATLKCEKLPIKIFLLNNQHLGMVVQWEDRFHDGNRAHTYLGPVDHPEATGDGAGGHYEETYPNFVEVAKGFGLQAAQVRSKKEFPAALAKMLASPEPYLLDIVCPYQEHVLPMIPSGRTVRDIIIE
jgi:acetolactate synthase I/II/III large subunit